ncbi:unnamed protein product, partial [Pleuronectes platessa]
MQGATVSQLRGHRVDGGHADPAPRACADCSFRLAPTEPAEPSVTDIDDNKLRQGRSAVETWQAAPEARAWCPPALLSMEESIPPGCPRREGMQRGCQAVSIVSGGTE